MHEATNRQLDVLYFVHAHTQEKGYAPSLRQVGDALEIRSTNGVNDHLHALERKGLLSRAASTARGMVVTPAGLAALQHRLGMVVGSSTGRKLRDAPWVQALPDATFLCAHCGTQRPTSGATPLVCLLHAARDFHLAHQRCVARKDAPSPAKSP